MCLVPSAMAVRVRSGVLRLPVMPLTPAEPIAHSRIDSWKMALTCWRSVPLRYAWHDGTSASSSASSASTERTSAVGGALQKQNLAVASRALVGSQRRIRGGGGEEEAEAGCTS